MELEHSFTVPATVEDAWAVLLDIERIAPCMPGASLDSIDGEDFTGTVKVKLGPINLTYKGKASFIEKDHAAHRAVIDARGKDSKGAGTASAKVTATLTTEGDQTVVLVATDLDITGKPAQFGRGVMVDVGNRLIGQFASCLAEEIRIGDGTADDVPAVAAVAGAGAALPPVSPSNPGPSPVGPAGPAAITGTNGIRPARREAEPINLLESAGPAVFKRAVPSVTVLVLLVLLVERWRRGR